MSSITQTKNGGYNLQFFINCDRYTMYLSRKYSRAMATRTKEVVDTLLHCQLNMTQPPRQVVAWIESAPLRLQNSLRRAGLIEMVKPVTCYEMIEQWIAENSADKSKGSKRVYKYMAIRLYDRIDKDVLANQITPKDIQLLRDDLLKSFKNTTAYKTLQFFQSCFTLAIKRKQIAESPILDIGVSNKPSRDDDRVIKVAEYRRLLEACNDNQWRVIIALARVGGFRCPSEAMTLRWSDVQFDKNIVVIRSPKTKRHKGGEGRVIPMFAELREELERLYFDPNYGSRDYVITLFSRKKEVYLGSRFNSISRRAGLGIIRNPFDNMRTTRSNEINRLFGSDLENAWIGHSDPTRKKYYYMQAENDIEKAIQNSLIDATE
jgi:integrase